MLKFLKKNWLTLALVLAFLAGLCVLLYPYVSSYLNSLRQSRVVSQYQRAVSNMSEEDFSAFLKAANAYNGELLKKGDRFKLSEEELEEYNTLLNITGSGVMGTLEIDKINVNLPIYHGTNEAVLQIGAGHFEGTSLPVGGPSTHTVITGHRGLPSSTLLTRLDRMEEGDTFILRILNMTLTYEVDRILVVEPDDVSALGIEPDMDYCTLVTCTPYGINSHRMLVRGHRVTNTPSEPSGSGAYSPESMVSDAKRVRTAQLLPVIISPVAFIMLVYLASRLIKIYGKRRKP